MMEIACLTVEMAAKGGGVCPEVLFSVAKHWFDLYMRVSDFSMLYSQRSVLTHHNILFLFL